MNPIKPEALDLNLLKMFVAVAKTQSVSLAGEQLGLSQPAASNALSRLRTMLGDPLFVRTNQGMTPTPYAEDLLTHIESPLSSILGALAAQPEFDPDTSRKTFRLSLSGLGEVVFLPPLVERLFSEAPNVRIRNVSVPASDLADALDQGDVDVAIGMIDISARGLKSETLFDEVFVALASMDYSGSASSLTDLKAERLVISTPAATYASGLGAMLRQKGLADNVALQLSNFVALPRLLEHSKLVAILPSKYGSQLVETGQARILPIEITPKNTSAKVIWSEKTESDPAMQWLMKIIVELFQEPHDRFQNNS